MIGLASGLLAIAGLFAGRAVAIAHARWGGDAGLGVERHEPPARSPSWNLVWLPIVLIAAVATGPVVAIGGLAGAAVDPPPRSPTSACERERHRAAEQIADAVGALSAGLRAGSVSPAVARVRARRSQRAAQERPRGNGRQDRRWHAGWRSAFATWADAQAREDALLIVRCLGSSSSQWRRSADGLDDLVAGRCESGVPRSATCAPSRPKPVCRE